VFFVEKDNKAANNRVFEGDYVTIALDQKRKWVVRIEKGKELHTHKGVIDLGNIIGLEFGSRIKSSGGTVFYVFRHSLPEAIYKFKRATQIVYPKDYGLILIFGEVVPGSRVIEVGVGSGALTAVIATYVGPSGRVYGYEINEKNLKIAEKNLEKLGILDVVELKIKDATEGFDEKNIDTAIVDMGDPWEVIPKVYNILLGGGNIVVFVPTFNQIERVVQSLEENNFGFIRAVECLLRDIEVKRGAIRPSMRMIGHTGFIIHAKKLVKH